jgi:hypothetical protein
MTALAIIPQRQLESSKLTGKSSGTFGPDIERILGRIVCCLPIHARGDVIDVAEVLGKAVPGIAHVVEQVGADDVPPEAPAAEADFVDVGTARAMCCSERMVISISTSVA